MTHDLLGRRGAATLLTVALATGPLALVTAQGAAAQVSGDNGRLAVFRTAAPDSPPGVWTMNPDGSDQRLVWNSDDLRTPEWSPDGQRLAVTLRSTSTEDGGTSAAADLDGRR